MYEFLIGLVIGAAIGICSYMLGHGRATAYWSHAVSTFRDGKIRAEDELLRAHQLLRDYGHKTINIKP